MSQIFNPADAVKGFQRVLILLMLSISAAAIAMERRIEMSCPLGGRDARGVEILGNHTSDVGLDGRRYGHHVQPNPPPECPDNGFLVYKKSFSDRELSHLKQYIFSPAYQRMWHRAPAFYRLAKIHEYEKKPILDYVYFYMLATWEVSWGGGRYRHYALEAIEAFKTAIDQMRPYPEVYGRRFVEYHYLLAELYRRVGEFGNARRQLDWVKQTDLDTDFIHPSFIDYLDDLIAQRDSDEHRMSEAE